METDISVSWSNSAHDVLSKYSAINDYIGTYLSLSRYTITESKWHIPEKKKKEKWK